MVNGGAKYSTERVKCTMEVLSIPRRGSNGPQGCLIFHGQCQMFHGGAKYSKANAKGSTEVPHIRLRGSNDLK